MLLQRATDGSDQILFDARPAPLPARTKVGSLTRFQQSVISLFVRNPWIGWAAWLAFCINSLLRNDARRFGSTFEVYLNATGHFWSRQPIYDTSQLGDYLYWPVSLLALGALPLLDTTTAAAVAMAVSAVLLSLASVVLLGALLPQRPLADIVNLAGILLLINIPAAWYNFKYVQAQIAMTAFMMLAAAAMARRHWLKTALWLFLSVAIKPLSLVMLLLCGAAQPRLRFPLGLALIAALLLPFAFADAGYVGGQYRAWLMKLSRLAEASPAEWPYQADFATMLSAFGVVMPAPVATGFRLAAALGTLIAVRRIARLGHPAVLAIGVTLLSACYITLFGPRNEFLSFLVLTPPLAALALIMLVRDPRDQRAWALIVAVLVIGFHGALAVDRVLKPFLTSLVFIWLIWMTLEPARWVELLQPHNGTAGDLKREDALRTFAPAMTPQSSETKP